MSSPEPRSPAPQELVERLRESANSSVAEIKLGGFTCELMREAADALEQALEQNAALRVAVGRVCCAETVWWKSRDDYRIDKDLHDAVQDLAEALESPDTSRSPDAC